MTSTQEDLATDLAACEAATAGPWGAIEQGHCGTFRTYRISPQVTDRGGMTVGDANYCVRARTRFPQVVRELIEARAEIDRLRDFISRELRAARSLGYPESNSVGDISVIVAAKMKEQAAEIERLRSELDDHKEAVAEQEETLSLFSRDESRMRGEIDRLRTELETAQYSASKRGDVLCVANRTAARRKEWLKQRDETIRRQAEEIDGLQSYIVELRMELERKDGGRW